MSLLKAKITGTGSAFPPQLLENEPVHDAVTAVHNGEVWDLKTCEKLFGVKTRHWSRDINTGKLIDADFSDIGLSTTAAKNALDMAGLQGSDLDLIIHTTGTADYWVDPDPAIHIHNRLGAKHGCGAFTLAITCVGLSHAMGIAQNFIKSGSVKNVLVTASNIFSMIRGKAWQMMFFVGDAASAVVLSATDNEDGSGIISSYMGADHGAQGVYAHYNTIMEDDHQDIWAEFNPDAVAREGAKHFRAGIHSILDNHEEKPDWVITHQANYTLQKFAGKKFGLGLDRVPYNLVDKGNTLDASCGTVLDQQVRNGNFKKGDLVAMVAVGTGWHYSSALLTI